MKRVSVWALFIFLAVFMPLKLAESDLGSILFFSMFAPVLIIGNAIWIFGLICLKKYFLSLEESNWKKFDFSSNINISVLENIKQKIRIELKRYVFIEFSVNGESRWLGSTNSAFKYSGEVVFVSLKKNEGSSETYRIGISSKNAAWNLMTDENRNVKNVQSLLNALGI